MLGLQFIPNWYPSGDFDAQSCHFAWGALIIYVLTLHWGIGFGLLGLAIWIIIKEFGFDFIVEHDSVGNSIEDSVFYLLGGVFGTFLLQWK